MKEALGHWWNICVYVPPLVYAVIVLNCYFLSLSALFLFPRKFEAIYATFMICGIIVQ